jgi:Prokaryotic E2 family E
MNVRSWWYTGNQGLRSGAVIPQTQVTESIFGTGYQRWSRHRQWDSARDTLATHLALVEESLRREVEK